MHRSFLLIIVVLILSNICAQGTEDGSQGTLLKSKAAINDSSLPDNTKIDHYQIILKYYSLENLTPDSIIYYSNKVLSTYNEVNDQSSFLLKRTYKYLSVAYWYQSNFKKAVETIEQKFERFPNLSNYEKIPDLMNLGLFKIELGEYIEGMEYLFESEKTSLENMNKHDSLKSNQGLLENLSNIYTNISLAFENLGDHKRAIEFSEKSIEYLYKSGLENPDDLALIFGNISVQYLAMNKLKQAKIYIDLAFKELEKVEQEKTKGFVKYNYASLYVSLNEYQEAEILFLEAIEHFIESENENELGGCYRDIGGLYLKVNEFEKAKKYLQLAEYKFINSESQSDLAKLYLNLSNYYELIGDKPRAFDNLKKHLALNSLILNDEIKQKGLRKDFNKQFEKQNYIDSLENAKKDALNKEILQRKDIELKAKRDQQIILGGGFLVSALLLFLVFRRYRQNLKQKSIIESQHVILYKKNSEILDSINYAKRLQSAILPRQKTIKKHFPNSFVFFKPKDVVSGDFYFMDVVEGSDNNQNGKKLVYYVAADCTGHGVPGAMVSIVGANGLKRCIQEFGLRDPGEILDRLASLVVDNFSQSEETIRDGMDIALCCIEYEKDLPKTLHYAGANNPLWIINPKRKNIPEAAHSFKQGGGFEIKADKQAIGYTEKIKPFTTHSVTLESGDTIYSFSDGFPDQFGGEKGKKYKSANFKNFLLSIYDQDMSEQRNRIAKEFEEWKYNQEQIDDVCIIGVRL